MKIVSRIRKKFLLKLFVALAVSGMLWLLCENAAVKLLLPMAKSQIESFTGSEVEIASIKVQLSGLTKMTGVIISSCLDETGEHPLLTAKTIEAEFPVSSLLTLRPRLRSLTVDDFILDLRYDLDLSSWNLAFGNGNDDDSKKAIPTLTLKRGKVRLSRVSEGVPEKIITMDLEKGSITSIEQKNSFGFSLNINSSSSALSGEIGGKLEIGKSGKPNHLIVTSKKFSSGSEAIFGNIWNVRKLRLDMDFDNDNLTLNTLQWNMADNCKFAVSGEIKDYRNEANFNGKLHVENVNVSDKARLNALVYDEGLSEIVGSHIQKFLDLYEPTGIGDLNFKADGKIRELLKSNWSGTVTCKDASIQHKKFPYRIDSITGDIHLSRKTFGFSNLMGKHGDVVFDIIGGREFTDGVKVTDIKITSDNLMLGNDLFRALSKKQQKIMYTFLPKGRARINYSYFRSHDQKKGRSEIQIDMLGGEARYLHFPYHLKNITGRITIDPEEVRFTNLVSGSAESSITLNGNVSDIRSSRPRYDIKIKANNVPLDSQFKAALPYSQRSFYDSFQITARTDANIHIFPNETGIRPVEYIAEISIKDASMMYENFPLPLTNVSVNAVLTPADTRIKMMTGRNGDGTVEISGTVWPPDEDHKTPGYSIKLNAKNILVQDKWLKSLPADSYEMLSKLQPKGAINVNADLNLDPRIDSPEFKIEVECLGDSVNYTKFPYLIENIYGKVTIRKDKITLENFKSVTPAKTLNKTDQAATITADGTILAKDRKITSCNFSVFAKNISFNDKLKRAFDNYSTGLNKRFNPSGFFDLAVDKIVYQNDGDKEGLVNFSSKLTLKEFSLKDNGILGEINGTLDSTGIYKVGEGLIAGNGQVNAKNVEIKGRTIENILGEINYDRKTDSFINKEYTARCYGGKVLGSFSLTRNKNKKMDYSIETIFSRVNLNGLVAPKKDSGKVNDYKNGLVSGFFAATGKFGDDPSRIGRLNLNVSEMTFAERSLMGKLITASQLDDPTDYIFSNVHVESYLKKDTLSMEKVEIFGKSMQMRGAGTINLANGSIGMKFNAFGKRSISKPSFIETLMRSLGSAVVEIEIDGTFDKPIIKATVPVISKPFGIFGTKKPKK